MFNFKQNRIKSYIGSRYFLNIIIFLLSIGIAIIIYSHKRPGGYEYLYILPMVYMFSFIIVFSKIKFKNLTVFHFIFILISFLRYCILPFLIVLSGYYGGRSKIPPSPNSYNSAILIMAYELIICSIYILYLENKKKSSEINSELKKLRINNYNLIYILFAICVLLLIFLNPNLLKKINFIFPTNNERHIGLEPSLIELFSLYSTIQLQRLIFIIIIYKLKAKYDKNNKKKYIYIIVLLSLINISLYVGTNRSAVLINALVTLILIYKLFGKKSLKIIILLSIIVVMLISAITIYRDHKKVSNNSKLINITDTLQVYLGGPYNVAIALETKEVFPEASDFSVLFADIFRPAIGINIFIKKLNLKYSNIFFNKRIWVDIDRRSQIIPMIGQGNLFFGFFLSPIFHLIFIKLSYFLRDLINKYNRIELFYFLNMVLARLAFMMGQNTMNMINYLSLNLFLFLIIYISNNKVKIKIILKKYN